MYFNNSLIASRLNGFSFFRRLTGSEYYPDLACPWVHVKDVVEAHIRAFETPSANGRYPLGERVLHFTDILKILHESYPSLKLPDK
ncbi:Cinnamoyl-CoA reductase 1 [Bienertia sinuspersici]